MSEDATTSVDTEEADLKAKLEALAADGFHLVVNDGTNFIIEKTHLDGTLKWAGESLEDVISQLEAHVAAHPGVPATTLTNTDGIHEGLDLLQEQAGKSAPTEGLSGTTPSARPETVDISAAPENQLKNDGTTDNTAAVNAAIEEAHNTGAGENAEAPDAEAQAAEEAVAAAAPAEPAASPIVSETPGETVEGRVGEEPPAEEPAPAPEGAVES